jgi:hypothetical protein
MTDIDGDEVKIDDNGLLSGFNKLSKPIRITLIGLLAGLLVIGITCIVMGVQRL